MRPSQRISWTVAWFGSSMRGIDKKQAPEGAQAKEEGEAASGRARGGVRLARHRRIGLEQPELTGDATLRGEAARRGIQG